MLNAYSRRKDGNALLSRSFRVREFACRDGSDPLFVDSALVQLLQSIRDHFGVCTRLCYGTPSLPYDRARLPEDHRRGSQAAASGLVDRKSVV